MAGTLLARCFAGQARDGYSPANRLPLAQDLNDRGWMTGFAGQPGPAWRGDSGSEPWPEADEPPGSGAHPGATPRGQGARRTGPDENWQARPQPAVDYATPSQS